MVKPPYLLRHKDIAHISAGKLYIGGRRAFPETKRFVRISDPYQAADAITHGVTQGGGPLEVALMAMIFTRDLIRAGKLERTFATFVGVARSLSAVRPTNTTMRRTLDRLLSAYTNLDEAMERVEADVHTILAGFDRLYHRMGRLGATIFEKDCSVLTTCFGEHTLLYSLAYAQEAGKRITLYVNETRPYLLGSRLTAPSAEEMGINVIVIGDGMGANLMRDGMITHYMTACDVLCMDGTVVYKVGTRANAIAAQYHHIPYHAFSISPDPTKHGEGNVVLETRNTKALMSLLRRPTLDESIKAYYPVFDIIEADLVTAVVTPKGILKPTEVKEHFG